MKKRSRRASRPLPRSAPLAASIRAVMAAGAFTALVGFSGCATLGQVVQAPILELDQSRTSTVQLLAPTIGRPLGGAQIEVWARVENPNPLGFTLSRLAGTVLLRDQRAADVDLPLGLPLEAGQDTVIPLRLTLSLADVPELLDQLQNALSTGRVDYALRGTLAVDADPLGQLTFGPQTWLDGEVRLTR